MNLENINDSLNGILGFLKKYLEVIKYDYTLGRCLFPCIQ